jgi:hypothetical protein
MAFCCHNSFLSRKSFSTAAQKFFFFFALGAIRKLVKEMDLGAAFREVSSVKVWESKGLSYLNIRF